MGDQHERGMGAECQAMMAKIQEVKARLQVMGATLVKLVAEMNTAGATQKAGAVEKPVAAVINELAVQRMDMRSTMMGMHAVMRAHAMRHVNSRTTTGATQVMFDCPLVKMGGQQGRTPHPTGEEKWEHH
ncbi:hypothetical protein JXA88_03930 [Candidatus Fermentibacteria bacterium]|nr:hypothetical protein [Candidatus Fermentibacteria bacterium]